MNLQEQMAKKAKELANLKIPYKHRGKTRRGCDCSGLLILIMNELGYLQNFKLPKYPIDWNLHSFAYKHNYLTEYIAKYASQVEKDDRQPGDVLLFKYAKVICHSGIFVGNGLFVHSYILRPVSFATLNSSRWNNRLEEVWRIDEGRII